LMDPLDAIAYDGTKGVHKVGWTPLMPLHMTAPRGFIRFDGPP
jgi:hypothetical protein